MFPERRRDKGCYSTDGELVRAPSSNHWVESPNTNFNSEYEVI